MLHKGSYVEVITDVLPDETLSAQNLLVYRRSSYLKLIMSAKSRFSPYMSLRDVEPKPLWKFPGHPAIKDEWFSKLLVFDGGQHDLIIDSDAVRQAIHPHPNDELIKIIAGEFVIPAATQIVVGEAGIVWSMDPTMTISESLAEWKFVVDLRLQPT